ncbi:hypothetical protein [Legionella shakespearei]|uniref:Uncharacterized protein n=1 Tax=Legionella shakespearei DSM 23087 TaxID=1122169 RepID=A0A0W0YVE2_9GAMM|nr:hypothetical protein [Legionella shakespearei]KTD60844.1 hypothetical protein Lsha_1561 [Legionella shakespearei DSM 23087]
MKRYTAAVALILSGFIHDAFALPWFHTELIKQSISKPLPVQMDPVNFSGVWAGQCDNKPAVDLRIKHHNNTLDISYGFMEEHYVLGEVKSEVRMAANVSEHNNTTVRWSDDKTALIFINSTMFTNPEERLNVFFSKVTMSLESQRLIVSGHHYQTDSSLSGFNQETMLCDYQKIKDIK